MVTKPITPQDHADMLSDLIGKRLGFGGDTLSERAAKAGRKIPKRIQRDLALVAQAADTSVHPKLSRQIDKKQVTKAAERATTWLMTYDRVGRRRGAALDLLALIVFNLVLVTAALIAFLLWRNLI
ncbi:MAG: hypothetical protein HRU32_16085 [Rhodobacteraceae bacterium]|nr:hypothetical protein [Paracoccaceae bacterium]